MSYIGVFLGIVLLGMILVLGIRAIADKSFLTSGFLGVGSLFLISSIFNTSQSLIAANFVTVSAAFFLGVPGVVGMLLLRLITMF